MIIVIVVTVKKPKIEKFCSDLLWSASSPWLSPSSSRRRTIGITKYHWWYSRKIGFAPFYLYSLFWL